VGESVGTVLQLPNVHSYIVRRMAPVFKLGPQSLELLDSCLELLLAVPKGDAVIGVDDEDDVPPVKDTVINEQLLEAETGQLLDQILIPHSPRLPLSLDVAQQFEDMVH
jgi:hypothetical protein